MINIIERRGWWYIFSGILLTISIASIVLWGLKFGIDFTGGSLMEVEFAKDRPSVEQVTDGVRELGVNIAQVQPAGDKAMLLRLQDISEETHQKILAKLKILSGADINERSFESIGPTIGNELKRSALWAILLALFFIVSYIAWAFRKVSRPVASWKYGVVAIVALVHDLLITIGVFSILGRFAGVEIDTLFVSALLTVLGFSVHDTIVVFDRTRENLFRGVDKDFSATVNRSVNDTIMRSINTSITTLLALSALYFFGGESIRYFTLALLIGIAFGTYSSIFVASPLLVDWHLLKVRKNRG